MTKYTGGAIQPEQPQRKTKLSWEDPIGGTVTAWINSDTREIIDEQGSGPNPDFQNQWQEEKSRITGQPVQLIPNNKMTDLERNVIDRYVWLKNHPESRLENHIYIQTGSKFNLSRGAVYNILKKYKIIPDRKKT